MLLFFKQVLRAMLHIRGKLNIYLAANRIRLKEGGSAVCYLTHRFPARPATRNKNAVGGAAKLSYLAEAFPHAYPSFNLLYVVSSVMTLFTSSLATGAKKKGIKVVLNQNGVAYPAWHGPGWERTNQPMAAMLHTADYVLYQSLFCKLSADRYLGARAAHWEILHNAVDTRRFAPASTDPAPNHLVLLLGGTQYQYYRLERALQTLARLIPHRRDSRLLVTGRLCWIPDEAEAARIARRLASELGLQEQVTFLGPYAQDEAPAIYQRAHMLIHTKYNDPCPAVVLEAMASGLPVVYSHSGGVPELVGPEAGLGVPTRLSWERDLPPDPEKMAQAILQVAERRPHFAEAARQRAVEQFDLHAWIERHRRIFEGLLEQ